jgi:transposase-like protein
MTKSRVIPSYVTRPRWTSDEAREALTAQADSGLSVSAFAAAAGLDPQRLYLWRRRFAAEADAGPAFVELRGHTGECIEVVLRSGHVLRVPASFEAESLRRLLDVLEPPESC